MIFSVCRDNGLSFSQGTTTKPPPLRTFSDSAPGHCCGSSSTKAKETITYWVLPFIRRSLMLAHLILCKLSIMMILILETQTLKHREIKWLAGIIQLIMASTAKYGSNFIAKKRYIQKKKLIRDSVRSEVPLVLSILPRCFEGFPLVTPMNTRSGRLEDRSCEEVSLHLSLNAGSF